MCDPDSCKSRKDLLFYNPDPDSQNILRLQVNGKVQPSDAIVMEHNGTCLLRVVDGEKDTQVSGPCKKATVGIDGNQHTQNLFDCEVQYSQRCQSGKCSDLGESCSVDGECAYPYVHWDSCKASGDAGFAHYTVPPALVGSCGAFA